MGFHVGHSGTKILTAIGQFIAAGVLQGLVTNTTQWAYRVPFAVQWAWPLPLMILCFFCPESPWFLVRKDRLDDARRTLKRLGSPSEEATSGTVAMLLHTVKIENEVTQGSSYWDCFKGVDLRRTEICCVTFAGQVCYAVAPSSASAANQHLPASQV